MKILRISLVILFIIVFLGIIAGGVFVRYTSRKALPDYNANVRLEQLTDSVIVIRDSTAMPHIYASDETDLYRTVGYLMAQDRLWQMDLLRRLTLGRLSEILGKDLAVTDQLFRSLHFSRKSLQVLEASSPEIVAALQAFSDGINNFLDNHHGKLPPEFSILGYQPEPWEPVHSVNLIGYMSWSLTTGWSSEVTLFKLGQTLPPELFAELVPDMDIQRTFIMDESPSLLADFTGELERTVERINELGLQIFQASNNWAVSASKSESGHAILANDMHLDLNLPGIWYQMHQVVPGNLNVSGVVLPGQPFIICGHNENVAWGMTNVMADNLDFYLETLNPGDSSLYRFNGEWKKMIVEKEEIFTREGDTIIAYNQFTHRGPVISKFRDLKGPVVSMRWSGNEFSNELLSVYLFNRMKNWDEFREASRSFISISQNIAYADIHGNIGLQVAAGIPVREGEGIFIVPGDTSLYDWKGFVPFDELPFTYNPEKGYVASANNRSTNEDYPYYISSWFDLPNRVERIREELERPGLRNVKDMMDIQANQVSVWAQKILPFFLENLQPLSGTADRNILTASDLLSKWDYTMDPASAEPVLFEQWYMEFVTSMMQDEMAGDQFREYFKQDMLISYMMDKLRTAGNSAWMDDKNTGEIIETTRDIAYRSLDNAIKKLSGRLGRDISKWEWGKVHALRLDHPLGQIKFLDRAFSLNLDPAPVGGSYHTVSPYSYSFRDPYNSRFGSSQRHIYVAGDWERSMIIIPAGNSGIPASPHYADQAGDYINYRYNRELFERSTVEKNRYYQSVFYPEEAE